MTDDTIQKLLRQLDEEDNRDMSELVKSLSRFPVDVQRMVLTALETTVIPDIVPEFRSLWLANGGAAEALPQDDSGG